MNSTTDTLYRDAVSLSLPREKTVRGYTIRRMPIGQFLTALQTLRDLPGEALDTLLPGLTPKTMLSRIKGLTAQELKEMAVRFLTVLPGYGISLVSRLIGVEEGDLLRDEMIGLDGLMEMLEAWMELNSIENFIKAAGALQVKVRKAINPVGSSGSSQRR
ncbi:MAG: hypothetical protein E7323_08400 [Clostridiales bacterium]|nr:hypothetical protein [Clostridiales bacterium]